MAKAIGPKIIISKTGQIRFIYTDELTSLLKEGKVSIKRASNVEPTNDGKWIADMSPIADVKLGPFEKRSTAIKAEIKWLNKHLSQNIRPYPTR